MVVSIASLAQATSITIPTGSSIDGVNAYEYLLNVTAGTQLATASISFNNITLTTSGGAGDDMSFDLINRHDATQTIGDNDAVGDYWQNHSPYSASAVALGQENFKAPIPVYNNKGVLTGYTYDTESWTYNFTSTALTDLKADALLGYFDIGIDPDCVYTIGSIVFNYTVNTGGSTSAPDSAMTASLLGMSFLGLMFFRRKLALN